MDAAVKKRWLKALRSGDYRKARGQLARQGNRRCCLGVLRDVTGTDEPDDAPFPRSTTMDKCRLSLSQAGDLTGLNDRQPGWDGVIAYIEKRL